MAFQPTTGSLAELQFWRKHLTSSSWQASELAQSCPSERTALGSAEASITNSDDTDAIATSLQHLSTDATPFHLLPAELLISIFSYANDPTCYPSRSTALMQLFPIMRLGHVCRAWRHFISTSMPTSWSTISVYFPETRHVRLVELWLIRTGERCPLTLGLYQNAEDDLSEEEYFSTAEILRLFISYVDRWQSIRFYLQDESPREPLVSLPVPRNLESATLWLAQWEPSLQYRVWDAINASTRLRTVDWRNLPPPESTPWTQIKEVTCRTETVQFLAYNLSRLQRLEILHVNARIPTSELVVDDTLIHLPSLRTLDLSGLGSLVLLHHLVVPQMEKLMIRSGSGTLNMPVLSDMISRSGCSLVSLDIKDRRLTERDFLDFFQQSQQHLMALKRLELQDMRISDALVHHLTIHDDDEERLGSVSLPALRHLMLHRCFTTVDGLVASMIKSRFRYGLRFAELHMRTEMHGHERDIAALRLLQAEGKHITWTGLQGFEIVDLLG